ncbi:MAG: response regulator [Oceanococcaceae bacterium]
MAWNILIVDDDPDIHALVVACLEGMRYRGRPVCLLHAMNAAEADDLLAARTDVAVALIDVQMETSDAGLRLVRRLRQSERHWHMRVVLLTGQSARAPEWLTTRDWDLDGYLDKAELSEPRLRSMCYSALRGHDLVRRLDDSRMAVLQAVQELTQLDTDDRLTSEVGAVIASLLGATERMRDDTVWSWQSPEPAASEPSDR